MKEAYDFLLKDNLLNNDDYVVVAVSGGPDSMSLLHLLLEVRKKIDINIVCAHVNHNMRKESEDEKVFVENYCKENNIYFEYMKINEYSFGNFHNEARNIRYNFFYDVLKKYNSSVLFTAHHGDDLIETILMRIVRGSSLKGYAGFSMITNYDNYKVVRPLIFYTKDDILKYNKLNNVPYVIDSSNNKDSYTRNRYRHYVLPFLKSEDSNVHRKFLGFSKLLNEYESFLDKYVDSSGLCNSNSIDISLFIKKDEVVQRRVVENILKRIYEDNISIVNSTHVESIMDLIRSSKPNLSIKLPNNIDVIKEYDRVSFIRLNLSKDNYDIVLDRDAILPNGKTLCFVREEDSDSNYVCRLDSTSISLPLHVRNRRNGDKIYVKHLHGSKKVKDIFIDEKIPISKRNEWPIVVDSNNVIIWIPGVKKSKYNKEKNEKCDIIIKYC